METTRLLENDGYTGRLWILDFLPKFFAEFSLPKIEGTTDNRDRSPLANGSVPGGTFDERRLPLLESMSMRLESTQNYVKRIHETIKTVSSLIRTRRSVIPTDEDYGLSTVIIKMDTL